MVAPQLEQKAGRLLDILAKAWAWVGGLILTGLAVMTVVSVIGRKINAGGITGITGDYELVEAGVAIAIFAFLPLCQLRRGHVTVDILSNTFPMGVQRALMLLGDVLITIVAFVIMWRLYLGVGEKFPYFDQPLRDALSMGYKPFFPETTYELEIQLWLPMAAALIGAVLFFVASVFTVWRSVNALGTGAAR